MVCPGVFFQFLFWISLMKTGLQQRVVTHIISTMCVVRQSTVLIPCSYGHSRHESLYIEEWVYQRSPEDSDRVVSQDPAFEGRVEFVNSTGGGGGNCSLLLKNVRDSDAGIFRIRFRSGVSLQTWSKSSGVSLKVTDAELEVISQYDVVTEGDWLVFFCGSCVPSIIVPTYIWRKDGRLYSQNYGTNQLDLNSVRLEDAGRYFCMLSGHEGLNSSSVAVKVRPGDPPKNTTIRISPSAVIMEGDSVTLTCSSKSNPLVHNYSWFKVNETSSVGSGQTYSITNINSSHSGWFYCEAQNKYGSQRSNAVLLMIVTGGDRLAVSKVTVGVIPAVVITSVSVILLVVFGICISRKRATSDVQNNKNLQHHRAIESSEETYMTLDPKTMSADYDTLDNVRKSTDKR
ncbi:cell adhesion molecule CEACAM6-like isoform X2 [Paramisgurnus dabryanus]|uniref:cell adhesion molecule CEACAM6-like isoform X2 n=1 Tax=Paramisgurnus dabryanus TaxID=90735 RepID=UPI0031F3B8E4